MFSKAGKFVLFSGLFFLGFSLYADGDKKIEKSFVDALVNQDTERLEEILKNNTIDLNSRYDFDSKYYNRNYIAYLGDLPIYYAVKKGNKDIFSLFLKYGADPNKDYLALHTAAKNNNIELVTLLCEAGVDVNARSEKKRAYANGYGSWTALRHAVVNHNKDMVKLLLQYGADVNLVTKEKKHILSVAIQEGSDLGMVKILCDAGACVNGCQSRRGNTPLHYALKNKSDDVAKFLIQQGADVTINGGFREYGSFITPIFIAVNHGNAEIVQLLCEAGTDVNAKNLSIPLLIEAVYQGSAEIVSCLAKHGAKVNQAGLYGETAMSAACRVGRLDMVKILFEKGASVSGFYYRDLHYCFFNPKTTPPLYFASKNGHTDVVRFLLEKGSKPNDALMITSQNGRRIEGMPLHQAVKAGHTEIVKLLLDYGADPNKMDNLRCDPIHYAADHGYSAIVKLLVQYGANIKSRFYVAYTGSFISDLLTPRMYPNGSTAFSLALRKGHCKLAAYLTYVKVKQKIFG